MNEVDLSTRAAAEPIVCTRQVDADPIHAFEVFTERFGEWWDPRLTPDPSTYEGADVEEVQGGVVALHHDGEDYPIGEVTVWEIGERFSMSFWLSLPPNAPTELTVDFEPSDGGDAGNPHPRGLDVGQRGQARQVHRVAAPARAVRRPRRGVAPGQTG